MMLVVSAEIALWAGELDRLHAMLSGRFWRAEPRRRVRSYIAGLVAGLDRKKRLDPRDRVWAWSHWRRRRQHQARTSHYRRRGYP